MRLSAIFILSFVVLVSALMLFPQHSGLYRSFDLYIPIACSFDNVFQHAAGTAFPVADNLVMTAAHIDCEGGMTEISYNKGITWERILDSQMWISPTQDIRIYRTKLHHSMIPASFRQPILGEKVYSYGVAFGNISTNGSIMRFDDNEVIASNTVAGGMSGSAIVAEDGKVVGLTSRADWTQVASVYIPTAFVVNGVTGARLAEALAAYRDTPSIQPR